VVATVIGAYLVNQYIVARPDAPPAAQAGRVDDAGKAAKTAEPSAAVSQPEVAKTEPVKLKSGVDKAAAEKLSDKPVARHQTVVHDKAPAKPVTTASASPEPVKLPEERNEPTRDPNEVLRAAVERLRASAPESPRGPDLAVRAPESARTAEQPRVPDSPRAQEMPRIGAPALPPAVNIAPATTASVAPYAGGAAPGSTVPLSANPAAPIEVRDSDVQRPTPPADIPETRADLSGDGAATAARKPSVAEDVLFAAKSVFHAVLPPH
jgi:hypothetical protein